MLTTESKAAAAVRIGVRTALGERGRVLESLRACFARTQVWLQAGRYVSAVMSDLPERNGWSIARFCGDATPDRTQRLLSHASWDTLGAMGAVRRFAVAGLDGAARRNRGAGGMRAGVLDETGQESTGAPRPASSASTWAAPGGSPTASTRCACPMSGRGPGTR